MKMTIKVLIILTSILIFTNCGSERYTHKELRTQTIPAVLQNKTWTLRKIYSEKILGDSFTTAFNNSNGTEICSFTFEFADKGELIMSFKEHKFKGVYLVNGDKFNLVYNGFKEKIIWTGNPECKITPTELGYVFNWREFEFQVQGQELTLKSKTGDTLLMTTTT